MRCSHRCHGGPCSVMLLSENSKCTGKSGVLQCALISLVRWQAVGVLLELSHGAPCDIGMLWFLILETLFLVMASRGYIAFSSGCLVKVRYLLCNSCKLIDRVKMHVCYEIIYGYIVNTGRNRLTCAWVVIQCLLHPSGRTSVSCSQLLGCHCSNSCR